MMRLGESTQARKPTMSSFDTKKLPPVEDVIAPDGSEVRVLLALRGGSMAHFRLRAGQVARAVRHRTVEEIWYFLSGEGEMWRSDRAREDTTKVSAGVCVTIPVGTRFQFRADPNRPLAAIAITMPPWPGEDEAEIVAGLWEPTV
jgi:mannose-6-phosphate isomerase-like protein (cupin superfamily)